MPHERDTKMHSQATIPNEMQMIIRRAAEPWQAGDSVKAGIDRAARRTGLAFRRARTLWYGQTETILAAEADMLRAWYRHWIETQHERALSRIEQLEIEWERLGGFR